MAPKTSVREDFKAASVEFIGTNVFLLLLLGAVQSSDLSVIAEHGEEHARTAHPSLDHIIFISTAAGVSLLGSAWMFYRITGGLFNPAVSLATFLIGEIGWVRFLLYVLAQILGAISAAGLVAALMPGPFTPINRLGDNVNLAQGLFIEVFATTVLLLAILMLAAEKHKATPIAPIGISMTLFAIHLWAVPLTGASMNPARSFGPAVITGFKGNSHHWIYWVGPFLGTFLAVGFYAWLKHTKYWTINPDQSSTKPGDSPGDLVEEGKERAERGEASKKRDHVSDREKEDRRRSVEEMA